MKIPHTLAACLALLFAVLPASAAPKWYTDLDEAKAVAIKQNKPLLVDFTGSDWCGFCIKLHTEVFDQPEFEAFAKNYVLVELDFPRKKVLPPEEKAKNTVAQAKFGVTGFPAVLLIDAKSGEAYGCASGYGPGTGPKAYLEKLSTYKNTAEGKAALAADAKKTTEASAKRTAQGAKIRAAIEAKDFDAISKIVDEDYAGATGSRKAVASINKAIISQRIDPANKERALKWADQALVEAKDDEKMLASMKSLRDRIAAGTNLSQPVPATKPAAKPAPEVKKSDKGA